MADARLYPAAAARNAFARLSRLRPLQPVPARVLPLVVRCRGFGGWLRVARHLMSWVSQKNRLTLRDPRARPPRDPFFLGTLRCDIN